jgi:hypothetical protein
MDGDDKGWNIHSVSAERQIARDIAEQQLDDDEDGELGSSVTAAERRRAQDRRDKIAQAMWNDYVTYTA